MSKIIHLATVAKRMDRILKAYQDQVRENVDTAPGQSTSTSTLGQMTYSIHRGLDKKLLNFAAQDDSESESHADSDSSDQSYELIESPPALRLRSSRTTKIRAAKRNAIKIMAAPTKRKQRKISSSKATSTVTSASAAMASMTDATDSDAEDTAILLKTTSKKATPIKVTAIKASGSFNDNDNRQETQ